LTPGSSRSRAGKSPGEDRLPRPRSAATAP
jgi:hypothetical protein